MLAYNQQYLDNRDVRDEAATALSHNIISAPEHDRILLAYPDKLYTPNFFIRIALFLLTLLAVGSCQGIFLLDGISGTSGFGIQLIIFSLLSYAALEWVIRTRKVYRSGIDDALLWTASGLMLGGVWLIADDHITPSIISLIVLLLSSWGVLRYADRLMACVAYGSLLSLIFYMMTGWGPVAFGILPFVVMTVAIGSYFLFTWWAGIPALRHYRSCLNWLRMLVLLSFYLAGNEYVIRTLGASASGHSGSPALGWLWWILTVGTPVFYIIRGIRQKDVIFLWAGMALTVVAVFTFRYYFHVMPAELAMVVAGSVLLIAAWGLIRYLCTARHGFTSTDPGNIYMSALEKLPIEGLILAETFKAGLSAPLDQPTRFGGGSGGGGGATGEF